MKDRTFPVSKDQALEILADPKTTVREARDAWEGSCLPSETRDQFLEDLEAGRVPAMDTGFHRKKPVKETTE